MMSLREKIIRWFWVKLGPPDLYFFEVITQLLELGIVITIRHAKNAMYDAYEFEYTKIINGKPFGGRVCIPPETIRCSVFKGGISARIIDEIKSKVIKFSG